MRSAVTLTVSGELDEPDPEDLEDEDGDDESETYGCWWAWVVNRSTGIPLDPFFVVARMEDGSAVLVGRGFRSDRPRIEDELDERGCLSDAPSLAAT